MKFLFLVLIKSFSTFASNEVKKSFAIAIAIGFLKFFVLLKTGNRREAVEQANALCCLTPDNLMFNSGIKTPSGPLVRQEYKKIRLSADMKLNMKSKQLYFFVILNVLKILSFLNNLIHDQHESMNDEHEYPLSIFFM